MRFDNMSHNEEKTIWKNLCESIIEQQRKKSLSFDADKAYQKAMNQIEGLQHHIKNMRRHVITANEPPGEASVTKNDRKSNPMSATLMSF